jgi:serine phosphatase RsbU (regulator of sigma subunit)
MKLEFENIFRKRSIGTKILIAFLSLSLISLGLLGYVALKSNSSLGDQASDDSSASLEELGEKHIKQIALDVAKQLEIYILDHPDMNVSQLQEDTFFSALAVQPVGETGYTAVTDTDSLICRFHANLEIVNVDLHEMNATRPGFWNIMAQTKGGNPAHGYYQWEEADGSLRQKYMYIAVVSAETEDDVTFSVAATTYISEFSAPARETQEEIEDAVQMTAAIIVVMVVIIIVMLGVASVLLARAITEPIKELTRGAEVLGKGDLEHRVKVETGDELEELAHTFNDMASYLSAQMLLVEKTSKEKARIERELHIAQEIQKGFLPIKAPEVKGYRMAGINLPAMEVGGDFYDFIELDEGKMGIVIADVSGKGVPAALFMAISKTLLRANAKRTLDPVEAIREVNTTIIEESDSGMFVTLFFAILDPVKNTFTYTNAGHNPPLLMSKAGKEFTLLQAKGIPLGVMDDMKLESKEVPLAPNEVVFLYTDGVTEAVNAKDDEFGTDRLSEILTREENSSPDDIISEVVKELKIFEGDLEQFDDITMVVLRSEGETR